MNEPSKKVLKYVGLIAVGSCLFCIQNSYSQTATSAPTLADDLSQIGAKSLGRAGSTVASSLDHDSLFQNPASATFSKKYAVTLGYLGAGNSLAASIVDTKSGPIGAGLFYMRRDLKNQIGNDLTLGNYARIEDFAGASIFGSPMAQLGIGATLKYAYRRSFDSRVANAKAWNFDIGARYSVNSQFILGAAAQNFMEDSTILSPRRLSAGMEYILSAQFSLSGQFFKVDQSKDSVVTLPNPNSSTGWSVGGEFRLDEGVALRAGYLNNTPWNQKAATAGLGYVNKSVEVNYAFEKTISGANNYSHNLSLTGYF